MRRQMEERMSSFRGGYEDAGFGKARADLDWVDPSKKVAAQH
jgi:hypothetical protein